MTDGASYWMIHGVVRASAPRPEDAPDHARAVFGRLAALLSPGHAAVSVNPAGAAPSAPLAEEAAAALAHNQLLTAYALETDVAPMRYGAAVLGPDAARALLAPETARYEAVLARVGGAVEYALRLSGGSASARVPAAHAHAASGRAHPAAERVRRDARDALGAARAACLAEIAAQAQALTREALALPPRAERLLDLALLVPRDGVGALLDAAGRWRDEGARRGLTLSLVGPWPPYGFTRAGPAR